MTLRALSASAILFAGLALGACGGGDNEANDPAGSGVNRELAEEGIDFDASTMDAMSIDVVAGGVPPSDDPATADANIDMLGRGTSEQTASTEAAAGGADPASDADQ